MLSFSSPLYHLALRTVAVVLVAGALAAVYALLIPNSYRARALLLLEAPQVVPLAKAAPGTQDIAALPMPDYRLLFTSDAMAAEVRDFLRAQYEAAGEDLGELPLEQVRRRMEVRLQLFMQTPETIVYQQVIELLFIAGDPQIAAATTNFWAERCIAVADEAHSAVHNRDAPGMITLNSAAIAPEEKIAPRRSLLVVLAMLVAAFAVPMHYIGARALERYLRQLEAAAR